MVAQHSFLERFTWFLIDGPSPEEILEFKITKSDSDWIQTLFEKHERKALAPDEERLLDDYVKTEHVVRMGKMKALQKIMARNE